MSINKAIFLDKDGTLIQNIPFNVNPDHIFLSEGMIKGLKQLMKAGYELIVVSDESGIAHETFQKEALITLEKKIDSLLRRHGIYLSGFYYCPPHSEEIMNFSIDCCTKSKSGLLMAAAKAHRINLSESWMIGTHLDDIEAGKSAGCKTVLITEEETIWELNQDRMPDYIAKNIDKAAEYILEVADFIKSKPCNCI